MHFEPIAGPSEFGARVTNVELRILQDPIMIKTLLSGLYRYGFLIFDDQVMSEREYINFGRLIGSIKIFVDKEYLHPQFPEIFVVSNQKREGRLFGMDRVGLYWHSDCSFLSQPQPITLLHCQIAPEAGGETAFVDMREVLTNLGQETIAVLRGTICEHEGQSRYIITEHDIGLSVAELIERDRKNVPPVRHPTLFKHPFTGREILYINEGFTSKVIGVDVETSNLLLERIFDLTQQSKNQYRHRWKQNQLIIWDNRSLLHRAFVPAPGNKRLMFRLGISDGSFFNGTIS